METPVNELYLNSKPLYDENSVRIQCFDINSDQEEMKEWLIRLPSAYQIYLSTYVDEYKNNMVLIVARRGLEIKVW